jgi:hypothetical protein
LAVKGISCFFVFLLVGAASAQSDFSAEIVDVQEPGATTRSWRSSIGPQPLGRLCT